MNGQDQAIVIGGGIAGVTSALSLADNGYQVYIIEKEASIGGHALQFCCKATEQCNSCGVCLAKDKIMKAATHPSIHILTHAKVVDLQGEAPRFQVEIVKKPRFIDEYKCIACSLCYQNCPRAGEAIHRPYLYSVPNVFSIDKDHCLYFQKDTECEICEEICPAGAIFFDQQEESISLEATAVIVASGFEPYDAIKKGYLGYGRYPEVISGVDLEYKLLMGEKELIPQKGTEKPRIAFIQCVGSRDPHIGKDYCSRVCCKYAARMAAKVKSQMKEAELTVFYIDLQKTERDFLALLENVKEEIRFIKGLPVEIEKTEDSGVTMRYENIDKGCMEKEGFDLVVLSVGISPSEENKSLSELLGVGIGEYGFFTPTDLMDSTVSSKRGIFLAGTCQGPKNLIESISHGQEAALKTLALMKGVGVSNG